MTSARAGCRIPVSTSWPAGAITDTCTSQQYLAFGAGCSIKCNLTGYSAVAGATRTYNCSLNAYSNGTNLTTNPDTVMCRKGVQPMCTFLPPPFPSPSFPCPPLPFVIPRREKEKQNKRFACFCAIFLALSALSCVDNVRNIVPGLIHVLAYMRQRDTDAP